MALIEPEQKMQTAKQIHSDMPLLDRTTQEIATITKNVSVFEDKPIVLVTLDFLEIFCQVQKSYFYVFS